MSSSRCLVLGVVGPPPRGLFINGLPIATFELKNRLTKQTVEDAVQQYKRDRDPRDLLFQFGRCLVHLAVDDQEVRFCTHLKGKDSWFLPFNKGSVAVGRDCAIACFGERFRPDDPNWVFEPKKYFEGATVGVAVWEY